MNQKRSVEAAQLDDSTVKKDINEEKISDKPSNNPTAPEVEISNERDQSNPDKDPESNEILKK